MKDYKNIILLKDYNDEKVDAILFTNESEETIQQAIYKAKNEFYDLEEDELPFGINCEYDYIYQYLCDRFDIEFFETWHRQEVYY